MSALPILDNAAPTTEQDDEDGERYEKMKFVECRRVKGRKKYKTHFHSQELFLEQPEGCS